MTEQLSATLGYVACDICGEETEFTCPYCGKVDHAAHEGDYTATCANCGQTVRLVDEFRDRQAAK